MESQIILFAYYQNFRGIFQMNGMIYSYDANSDGFMEKMKNDSLEDLKILCAQFYVYANQISKTWKFQYRICDCIEYEDEKDLSENFETRIKNYLDNIKWL